MTLVDEMDPHGCVEVRTFDVAGNEAPAATLCRSEAGEGTDLNADPNADPNAESLGCAFSPTGRGGPGALMAMLLGFAALSRRRRGAIL